MLNMIWKKKKKKNFVTQWGALYYYEQYIPTITTKLHQGAFYYFQKTL